MTQNSFDAIKGLDIGDEKPQNPQEVLKEHIKKVNQNNKHPK